MQKGFGIFFLSEIIQNSYSVKLVNEEKNGGNEVAYYTWTHAHLPDLMMPLIDRAANVLLY